MANEISGIHRTTLTAVCNTFIRTIERSDCTDGRWGRSGPDSWLVKAVAHAIECLPAEQFSEICRLLDSLESDGFASERLRSREQVLHERILLGGSAAATLRTLQSLTMTMSREWALNPGAGSDQVQGAESHRNRVRSAPQVEKTIVPTVPQGDSLDLDADVVVVGSGAGGGVIAGTLARQGLKVVVVEAGQYLNEADFTMLEGPGFSNAYWRGGPSYTADGNVWIQAGRALGGGTLINWTNCLTTSAHVRSEWETGFGLEGLAKSNDGLLRFVPDDRIEAKAIVALMDKAGIQQLVPVWRTDLGNQGLYNSVTAAWEKLKGPGSVSRGVSYPETQTSGFDKIAAQVSTAVAGAQPKGKTAVYLAAFGEAAGIVAAVGAPATSVAWFGGDGVVGDSSYTKTAAIAKATEALGLNSPQTGLNPKDKASWQPVLDYLTKTTGSAADAFGVNAYDASNAAIQVLAGPGKSQTGDSLEQSLISYANTTTGASGPLKLNQFGDRAETAYDYWQVTGPPASAAWTVTGDWVPAGGTLGTVVKMPAM
jgi:hypothetical protein